MQRIAVTIEDDLLAEIDAAAKERGYQNRSEIIRDPISIYRRLFRNARFLEQRGSA